jgi:guanylate kinase
MTKNKKIILICGPSGAGKSTLMHYLLPLFPELKFSVSATTRKMRDREREAVEYYFIKPDEFRARIQQNEFIEYEQVYKDIYYGTLKSEITRIWKTGKIPVLDIDVYGAKNVKKLYPDNTLSIFVHPGNKKNLKNRLMMRKSDDPNEIVERLRRADFELSQSEDFDHIVYNDKDIKISLNQAQRIIEDYIKDEPKNEQS